MLQDTSERDRFVAGFGWGVAATLAMSAVMLAGLVSGMSPMPAPVPAAILERLGGGVWPTPVLMAAAAAAHLAYGGLWGGLLAWRARTVDVRKGVGLGLGLWLLMQVAVLPFLGWGLFGAAITPRIAVATLLLHLVYGVTLGVLVDRAGTGPGAGEAATGSAGRAAG